jgi:hypothetical protein
MACKKERYLKIHISVNVRNKKILSMKITDERVHDGKVLPELVENVTKSNRGTIGKLLADGAFDNNGLIGYLSDNGILTWINVRKMRELD